MKILLYFISAFCILQKLNAQTKLQIKQLKVKAIFSYDKTYENGLVKNDTTIEVFDSFGNIISHFTTYLLRDTTSYSYKFDSLGKVIECNNILANGNLQKYYTCVYNPDGSYYAIMDQGSIMEERREYNKVGVLVSTFSDMTKSKTIFVLDSYGNYYKEIDSYKDKADRIIAFKLSYDSSGRMTKRSAVNPTGSEFLWKYNEDGLPSEMTWYFNKKNKAKKMVRTKTYNFY
jgi:hypothetical protein